MMFPTARQLLAQRALRELETVPPASVTPAYHQLAAACVSSLLDSDVNLSSLSSSSSSLLPSKESKYMSAASLVQKYGFSVESGESTDSICEFFKQADEIRSMIVVVAESDQRFFVNKEYLCAWSQQFKEFAENCPDYACNNNYSLEKMYQLHERYRNVSPACKQEFHFTGDESQFMLLLNAVWPLKKRLNVKHMPDIIRLCHQWVTHESLPNVAAYYLHSNDQTSPVEKLKLASQCGNLLLLYGALRYQCKRDVIFDIIKQSPEDFAQINKGPYTSTTLAKMLEHVAGEDDSQYRENLMSHLDRELSAFKRRLSETFDFSAKDDFRRTELVYDGQSFFVNKFYLAVCSPVFYRMFFSEFRDRAQERLFLTTVTAPTILAAAAAYASTTDERPSSSLASNSTGCSPAPCRIFHLFLSLLHPTFACAALKLMPCDECQSYRWLDDLFSAIFANDVDLLIGVFKLAHKYQVGHLVDICVLFIENKSDLSVAEKMLMADAYHLPTLMTLCVSKMSSPRTVKRIVKNHEYFLSNLSCKAHQLLLDKLINLI